MNERPQTWHYGLVAQWWAEFGADGPETAYFRGVIERYGQPALDVGCGTGRLLLPYRRAGLDVDGCDISPDMLALCRRQADREGLSVNLYEQAMHELDLPRTYRTIFISGSFGLGGERAHGMEALRRFHDHLEPNGVLAMDHHPPYAGIGASYWSYWLKDERGSLPEPWPPLGQGRRASDGTDFHMNTRVLDVDPLEQVGTLQIRVERRRDGRLVAEEEHTLKKCDYFKGELLMMLEQACFRDIEVRGGYTDEEANADHRILVYVARK